MQNLIKQELRSLIFAVERYIYYLPTPVSLISRRTDSQLITINHVKLYSLLVLFPILYIICFQFGVTM